MIDPEEKDKGDSKDKTFFQKFISYFKYDSNLDKRVNVSLLYNAYYAVSYIEAR